MYLNENFRGTILQLSVWLVFRASNHFCLVTCGLFSVVPPAWSSNGPTERDQHFELIWKHLYSVNK